MEVSGSHVNDPIGADSGVPGKQGLPPSPSKTISSANKYSRLVKKKQGSGTTLTWVETTTSHLQPEWSRIVGLYVLLWFLIESCDIIGREYF